MTKVIDALASAIIYTICVTSVLISMCFTTNDMQLIAGAVIVSVSMPLAIFSWVEWYYGRKNV